MAGRQLKQIVKAHREGDELSFRRAVSEIIEEEESKQHLALARDLRRLISAGTISEDEKYELFSPPTDRDTSLPLAQIKDPQRVLHSLILPEPLIGVLASVAAEVRVWARLDALGIPRRQRILLHGPPGCGKSSAAEALAAELGVPLVTVRIDTVLSSYLGETASNLRRLFDYAATSRCVLLFDEFDSLGKDRGDSGDHGELRRVVSSVLQMMDDFRGASLIVAATNHSQLLDSAVWRRFDEVLALPLPTVHQIRAVLRRTLLGAGLAREYVDKQASRLRGLPHAAAEKAAFDARRQALLEGERKMVPADLASAVDGVLDRPW